MDGGVYEMNIVNNVMRLSRGICVWFIWYYNLRL